MNRSTLLASHIVRRVFAATPELPALSTQQIYHTALTKFPDERDPDPPPRVIPNPPRKLRTTYEYHHRKKVEEPPEDPNNVHPIYSVRFLKKYVLEAMAERCELEKVHIKKGHVDDATGEAVDTIRGSITGRVFNAPSFISEKSSWLWRIIPESEFNAMGRHWRTRQNVKKGKKSRSRR